MARETSNRLEEPMPVAIIELPYPPEDPARGAEMKIANFAERFVTLGWNPR